MKKQKMNLLSCILMGIGSIIGASVFATTPIAIKIIGGNGIVIGFICAALFVFLRSIPEMEFPSLLHPKVPILLLPRPFPGIGRSSRSRRPLSPPFPGILRYSEDLESPFLGRIEMTLVKVQWISLRGWNIVNRSADLMEQRFGTTILKVWKKIICKKSRRNQKN